MLETTVLERESFVLHSKSLSMLWFHNQNPRRVLVNYIIFLLGIVSYQCLFSSLSNVVQTRLCSPLSPNKGTEILSAPLIIYLHPTCLPHLSSLPQMYTINSFLLPLKCTPSSSLPLQVLLIFQYPGQLLPY